MTQTYAQKIIEQRISNKNQNKKMNYNEYSESYDDYGDYGDCHGDYYDIDYGIPPYPDTPIEGPKKAAKAINIICLFKNCGKYHVFYKGSYTEAKRFAFDSLDKANNFLKIIYNHLDGEVCCSNMTVKNCNFKSWKSFFFMPENNEEVELGAWVAYKQVPLLMIKCACLIKCGYWPKLNNAQKQYINEYMIKKLKNFCEPFICEMPPFVIWSIIASVLSAVLICTSSKTNTRKSQSSEQMIEKTTQQAVQEYETQRTINLADTIRQKTK